MGIAFLVFFVVLAIIVGAYYAVIVVPEEQEGRAVRARLKGRRTQALAAGLVKARERLSVLGGLDRVLASSDGAVPQVTGLIARSGVKTTTGAVVLSCIFLATVGATVTVWFRMNVFVVLGAAALCSTFPILYLRRAAT